ncbi:MAG: MATE family efflux transporter [Oscillospiraceae bacterium]
MRITLSDHFTYQKLLRFTMPSIVMMIITSVYSIVDGFFVSNCVGKNAFAALNLIFPVLMALSAFGFMVGTGGSALIAKTLGEGKTKEANGIFSMLVAILAVGGAVLAAVFFVFIRPISYAVGATELTIDDCVLYGRILLVSLPLFMLQNSFQSFLATAEKPGFGLKVTVFAGLTNVVLDFLLVYVLPFGLAGAALATALSQAVGAAIPLAYFLRENDTPLRLGRPCFDLRALWRACCNGSSEMVSNLSGSLVGILYNIQLMAIARENGVSAYGVLMYVDFIFKAFFFGYSIAVTPVVGYHYGAQNHAELKSLLRKSLIITVLVSLVMTGASVTLAGPIADLFVGYDAALHDMTVNALRIYSVSFLVFGFQHLRLGVLHRVERRHGQRAHFVPADAGVSGRGDLAAAEVAGHQRHLARRHRRGIAHAARHRFAPCREAEKISLLSRKIAPRGGNFRGIYNLVMTFSAA